MKKTIPLHFALCLSLFAFPLSATADEILGTSKITHVMVFPNGAEVTREFSVDLPKGAHEVILKDLPARLQGRSLRVEGRGPQGLEIGSIDQSAITLALQDQVARDTREALQAEYDRLVGEKSLIQAEIDAVELQKKLLNEMALLPSRRGGQGEAGTAQDLAGTYSTLFVLMGDKFVEAQKRLLAARVKIRDVNKKITNIKKQLAEQPKQKQRATKLVVNVNALSAGKAKFLVRYQVSGAGWQPFYEARLKTDVIDKKNFTLVRRASIFQRTDEDWRNVRLILSTTNPTGRTKAPHLNPQFVDYRAEPKAYDQKRYKLKVQPQEQLGRMQDKNARALQKPGGGIMDMMAPAAPRAVKVSFGTYQMTFEVADLTTIERSGEKKKVFLDRVSFDAKQSLYAVPKKDRKAYLHASIENKTGNALLAGRVALFRDGIYVGHSHLRAVEPGQKRDIGFGVDPNVSLKWVRLDRVKGETGLITSSNSDVHRYKITINNGHANTIPIKVFDQMPYAHHEAIEISLLKSTPKPTKMNVDDKKGVMSWDLKLEPGKEKVIEFGYQLVWPKDKKITLR